MTEPLDPVARLVAIEEIKNLKARYFRFLDTKQWEEWGSVFADDVVMEIPEADAVMRGRADVVKYVSAALERSTSVHHGHMPEIEITGVDTARGVWAMSDYVEWSKKDGTAAGLRGYGHYLEGYVRENGEWRIAELRLERLRIDPLG